MSDINMYSVAVVIKLSIADALINVVVIAPSPEAALEQALVTLREGMAESATRKLRVVTSTVTQVDRELLARAATGILGWSAPVPDKKKGGKK
jgi:hypothetical protein